MYVKKDLILLICNYFFKSSILRLYSREKICLARVIIMKLIRKMFRFRSGDLTRTELNRESKMAVIRATERVVGGVISDVRRDIQQLSRF